MMDPANAHDHDDLFTTDTTGLPEVAHPGVTRLHDGDVAAVRRHGELAR